MGLGEVWFLGGEDADIFIWDKNEESEKRKRAHHLLYYHLYAVQKEKL
jgi:hypothetical protein